MDIINFDYDLPSDLIAQTPTIPRDESRLLSLIGSGYRNLTFSNLPSLMNSGDVLVINNTKVIKARLLGLIGNKKVTVTLHQNQNKTDWLAYSKPAKKIKENDVIKFDKDLEAKVLKKNLGGEILLHFNYSGSLLMEKISLCGSMPLPPYIKSTTLDDDINYQTCFAEKEGAVASPTAGLHFTEKILDELKKKNVLVLPVTLHVGAGTFLPVKTSLIHDHKMHYEWCEISLETSKKINLAKSENKKIIAVGTTVIRTLESVALKYGKIVPWKGSTNLFIKPGFEFKIVDCLLTNFHLPKSTLLILICSFFGYKNTFELYKYAIQKKYRFFSYGDCCFLPINKNVNE